jgi:hypothetical protein
MSGHAGSIAFGKIAGDKVRGNVLLAYKIARLRRERAGVHAPRRRESSSAPGCSAAG